MNQLVGFTDGETTASYAYNAIGLRYEKTVDGETVHHVWDGNQQIIADVVESQFYEANCYIRGTNLAATYHYQNGAKSDYTYYVQNAHGDVVNLTDAEGAVTKTYHYDAFGVELDPTTGDVNVFRYCGEYFDTETGTVYLRARYYQAAIGRFTQRDSYAGKNGKPLSLNLYTYCANNPIFYVDPSGHSYGTLPDGTKLSINSQHDAEKFYELRDKQLTKSKNAGQIIGDFAIGVVKNKVKTAALIEYTIAESVKIITSRINETHSYGSSISGSWTIAAIDVSFGYCYDYNGNIGVYGSLGGTVSTGVTEVPSVTYTNTSTVTFSDHIDGISGYGSEVGGSFSSPVPYCPVGVTIGGGITQGYANAPFQTDAFGDMTNWGVTTNCGIVWPPPIPGSTDLGREGHFSLSETKIKYVNLYDLNEKLVRRIMEW